VTFESPDFDELVSCAALAARAMGLAETDGGTLTRLMAELLHEPEREGGRELWNCYASGLITAIEVRNVIIARLATWLANRRGVEEPSSEMWCTAQLERAFDRALFPRSYGADAARREVSSALEAIACAEDDGALLRLEACPDSIHGTGDAAVPDEDLDAEIVGAARVAADLLGRVRWCRTSWTRIEFALDGTREALGERAKCLLVHLDASSALSWRAILIRVFPGEVARTLQCDPGYDIAPLRGSFVAYVEPYEGDDWRESQRYPTTTVVWRAP
jgi:hypothetical protein